MSLDLSALSDRGLRAYLRNCRRYHQPEKTREAARELITRGAARAEDLRIFDWNHDTVREFMRPFEEVASMVKDNQRKTFVAAGGFSRRAKDDPTRLWIDIYTAMKTSTMNAVFACHVKALGDEPTFVLELDGAIYETYSADRHDEALREWRHLAGDSATIKRLAA
jgi:hypothetical protein